MEATLAWFLKLYALGGVFCAGRLSRDAETAALFRERCRRWGVKQATVVQAGILVVMAIIWRVMHPPDMGSPAHEDHHA